MNRRAFRYCVRHAKMESGYYNRNKSKNNSKQQVGAEAVGNFIFVTAIVVILIAFMTNL